MIRFDGGRWQFHIPDAGRNFDADPSAIELIGWLALPPEQRAGEGPCSKYSEESLGRAVRSLVEAGILIESGSEHPLVRAWESWTPAAWFIHLAGQHVRFATTDSEQDAVAERIAATPPPSRYKCSCLAGRGTPLPEPRRLDAVTLGQALLRRRTCRLYDESAPVQLEDLADMLYYTGGVVFEHEAGLFGTVLKKCSPSPGARHSIELYPVVTRCAGLEPGSYHYCTQHHALNPISLGDKRDFITRVLQVQPYFTTSAVSCFLACATPRLRWKYQGPRIYRLAHLEAGHYCQNFLLAGTGLGLGVFSTGAIDELGVQRELEIDGVDEVVLYVAGAGVMKDGVPYIRDGGARVVRVPAGEQARLPGAGEPSSADEL
ncbi:MAG TPA: SagB/ThcOx family dehydrogenase [Allosphingosinicella sp.]|nr:SagB/ThcOx family dehydrogenase [Allosphingosinicella sp.]